MATSEVQEAAVACDNGDCQDHFHLEDPSSLTARMETAVSDGAGYDDMAPNAEKGAKDAEAGHDERGFWRIVQNFTPSWFTITMSTGVVSVLLHQLPYRAHWLDIVSYIFFGLNVALFVLFTLISCLRYVVYPRILPAVLRHPHQSLFLGTFPVGLATIINMIVLVCVPAWGHGMATFAWVLWWIDSALALTSCFQLTFVIISNRTELSEMTALYLIPIVAVVIVGTSGGMVAAVLPNQQNQLMTLVISYIFWGLGSPLSWIILTIYFLRLAIHKPLKREVIVSLLIPICPLGISGFSIILLGKLAKDIIPQTHALPHVNSAGETFYIVGVMLGLILWGFAVVWFILAIIMITLTRRFPFNMGWWGFVFPVGVFTLLTISLGEELESRFFKVLSCVIAVACVVMWLGIAAGTIHRSITGQMFYAPCLGTDLYRKFPRQKRARKSASAAARETA